MDEDKIRCLIFMLVMYSNETVICASIYEVLESRIYMVDIDKEGNENKQHEKMCSQTAMARLARVDNLWFIIAHPKFPFSNETR